jgi:hypothetical protein
MIRASSDQAVPRRFCNTRLEIHFHVLRYLILTKELPTVSERSDRYMAKITFPLVQPTSRDQYSDLSSLDHIGLFRQCFQIKGIGRIDIGESNEAALVQNNCIFAIRPDRVCIVAD